MATPCAHVYNAWGGEVLRDGMPNGRVVHVRCVLCGHSDIMAASDWLRYRAERGKALWEGKKTS